MQVQIKQERPDPDLDRKSSPLTSCAPGSPATLALSPSLAAAQGLTLINGMLSTTAAALTGTNPVLVVPQPYPQIMHYYPPAFSAAATVAAAATTTTTTAAPSQALDLSKSPKDRSPSSTSGDDVTVKPESWRGVDLNGDEESLDSSGLEGLTEEEQKAAMENRIRHTGTTITTIRLTLGILS